MEKSERAGETGERNNPNFLVSRLIYVLEIAIILIYNFLFLSIIFSITPVNANPTTNPEGILIFWPEELLALLISVVLGLIAISAITKGREAYPDKRGKSALIEVFSSFKMTKENYKYQILYAVLLVFLIYMPIDFLSYSIPGVMDFSLNALLSSENPTELDINGYLRFTNIIPFLLYVVIIQFCVGFREELYFRGILVSRGRKYMKPNNTIIVSSFIFGMSHFVYYSEMPQGAQSLFYSILWAVTAFIVGFAAATFFLKKRYILSIIIAHSINNIISTTALWMRRNLVLDFINIALRLYVPLLLVSLFLLIFYRQIVKNGLAEGKRVLSDYIKTAGTTTGGKLKIISADILIGILILMMGIFMF